MEKERVNQVQEAQSPIQDKPKEKHAKIHTNQTNKDKNKERILKAAREKQHVTCKGNPIHLTVDPSAETLQDRREWQDIFKELKGKNLQPRLQYPARIAFKFDTEIKRFSDSMGLVFISIQPVCVFWLEHFIHLHLKQLLILFLLPFS